MAFDIFWMNVAAVFAIVNVALVFLLLGLYYQSWRRLRSTFTISLMIFAVFFLVQNLVIIVFWYALYGLVPAAEDIVLAAAPYLVVINLLQSVGLGNLVRVTWS
ncbi:MAG: hypothetical protein E6K95_08965 [Thaumarchaeota archaeon]|nr:MAG: hypothetical protein E6K95_08965 [Nitrososphaerota archaeon]TLY14003.1 MAG: hypothetical protein E6K86_09005 [Nitrososphaerota archaeon]